MEEAQPQKVAPYKKLIIVLYAVELIFMGTRRGTGHFFRGDESGRDLILDAERPA